MTEPSRETLDDAMVRLANGDRGAITSVYRRLWPIVVRYCASLLRDPSDAEDIAQTSLLKLFEQAHDYDPTRPAEAWALTIAAWECRTFRTRRSRLKKNLQKMARSRPDASHLDGEEQAWRSQALNALAELVSEMSAADKAAIRESFEQGLSDPVHRKRKQRVLARLRRRWREVHGD